MDNQSSPVPETAKKDSALDWHIWLRDILICMAIVTIVFVFVVRLVIVDGESMEPTLFHKDMVVLLSNAIYNPAVGDIIVLRAPGYDQPLVKRVIATEGQTVDIDFAAGIVYVDGVALDEPYTLEPTYSMGDQSFPQTIAEDCVFVLGDNRNNSSDSRHSRVGQVPEEQVLGKVLFTFWPLSHLGGVK